MNENGWRRLSGKKSEKKCIRKKNVDPSRKREFLKKKRKKERKNFEIEMKNVGKCSISPSI